MVKIKFIQQEDEKDCGPVCMAMICQFYGKMVSLEKLRYYAGTDNQGTSLWGLVKLGDKLGLEMTGVEAEHIENLSEVEFPCIAHIVNERGFEHFVIIEKVSEKHIHIIDPDKGRFKDTKDNFASYWTKILLLVKKRSDFNIQNEKASISRLLINVFKVNHSFMWIILAASILINLFGFAGTFYFKILVDSIIPSNIIQNLHILSLAILVMYIVQSVITYFRYQLILHLSLRVDMQLMLDYYSHIINLPMNFFESRKPGEILSRFMDTSKVREAFSTVSVTMFVDVLMIIVGTILLFIQSRVLFMITLLFVPFYLALGVIFRKPYRKFNREQMKQNAELNDYVIETIHGVDTIKSFNAEEEVFIKAENHFIRLIKKYMKLGTLTNIQMSIKGFMSLITSIVILWFGSSLIIDGKMTLGELLTFNALVIYFFGPIERLIDAQPVLQSATVAAKRIVEVLELEKEEFEQKKSCKDFKSRIFIDQLSFHYGQRENCLKNINMTINKGDYVAVVGESGSGKSTLAKLIVNFYKPQDGTIRIDDIDFEEISNESIRSKIGYLSQNSFFFNGSIIENLTLGISHNIDIKAIKKACKLAKADEFINKLPQGYYSMLESNAENLSGGQIQRLAIARLLLHNHDILVLDEATSALDTMTEIEIIKSLYKLKKEGKTIVSISHKIRNIQNADVIYCLKGGTIIESGTHSELVAKNSVYYKLWINQSSKECINEEIL